MTKKLISTILALSLLKAQIAAAESAPGKIDLTTNTVVSLIYSGHYDLALIGLENAQNIVQFQECQVPRVAVGQNVTLSMLENCQIVPGGSFIADDALVGRINDHYRSSLPAVFVDEQRDLDEQNNLPKYVRRFAAPAGLAGFVAGIGGMYISVNRTPDLFRNGNAIKGTGTAVLGVASLVFTLASIFTIYWGVNQDPDKVVLVPLEKAVGDQQTRLVLDRKIAPDAVVREDEMPALYPAMKKALLGAIEQSLTL